MIWAWAFASAASAASRAVAVSVEVATEPRFAAADGEKRDGHDQRHGKQNQRDDQRDAALGVTGGGRDDRRSANIQVVTSAPDSPGFGHSVSTCVDVNVISFSLVGRGVNIRDGHALAEHMQIAGLVLQIPRATVAGRRQGRLGGRDSARCKVRSSSDAISISTEAGSALLKK